MRKVFFVIVFIASTLTLFSQPKLDSLVAIGNEQSFQFHFEQANRTFHNAISEYPNSSLGYYFLSRNYLWFYLANKDSISRNNYLKYFESAKTIGEMEYEKSPEDAGLNFNLGNIYLLKSIYSSAEQNTMDAFWATKSAVNYFEEATDLDENFYAPYLPLGTIKYALGFVPGFLGWAITVAGLDGEKEEGLAYIKNAYANGLDCKTEAAYHLGKLYTEYNAMYDSAEVLLSQIVKDYPQNELFLYQYAILQIDKRNLNSALKVLDKILSKHTTPIFHQTYALSFFLKGEILFKQNEFDKAIVEYERFILQASSHDYTGIANLKIALSYEMLDEKLIAQRHYILARNGNLNIAEDSYAEELSKQFYDKQFSESDKLFVEGKNLFESGKYLDALKILQRVESKNISRKSKFEIDIIKIDAYQNIDELQKSSKIIHKYVNNSGFTEFTEYPKFEYLMAYQKYKEKKYSEAKDKLDSAFDDIEADNNKLKRLLVNLAIKLSKIDK